MLKCQVCEKENPAGAEYCEDCGAALSVQAPAPVGAGVSGSNGSTSASASTPASTVGAPAGAAPTGTPQAAPPAASNVTPEAAPSSVLVTPGAESVSTPPPSADSAPASTSESTSAPASSESSTSGSAASAPSAQARLLTVRYGAPTGDEMPLNGQRLVVGRFDPETGPVDIDLSEAAESGHISRQHGELSRGADGSWSVRDLGSTNGVFVKAGDAASFGPRLTAPRTLKDGDELAFGNARFIFRTT
jgi:hypothetical protein